MSKGTRKSSRRGRFRKREGRDSLQLIEEAFHLLRTASARTHWAYFLGTVPFVAAVFYFWADMGSSSYAERDSTLASLGMVGAYFWMKAWHAIFCRRLVATVNPGQLVVFSGWKKVRYFAAQMMLQVFALPVLAVSLVLILPLPWTYAFFQNVSALGFSKDYEDRPLRELFVHALKLACRDLGQCIGILAIMKFIALFTWLNLVAAFGALTFFAKSFFDIETVFSLNPMAAFLNTTFLFGSFVIVFLVIAPMMKAIFVLRCFYADSRKTGADLLSQLAQFTPGKSTQAAAMIACVLLLGGSVQSVAQENGESKGSANVSQLEDSIRDTMAEKKYQWRFERLEMGDGEASEKTGFDKWLDDFAASIRNTSESMNEKFEQIMDRLFNQDGSKSSRNRNGESEMGLFIGSSFNVILIAVLVGLVIWLVYILIQRYRESDPVEIEEISVSGEIDLESENIVATQLHEDEWMKLAREKIAAGETRLAIRALFLASLAHLGERGMLHIKKFKSNYDYSQELRLKARSLPELQSAFGENVGLFERVWYGLHNIGDDAVEHFTSNYERIAAQKSVHELQQAEATPAR
ncbi:DUF4129 domain-containing protein [Verrucomicrobiales bacterium]|nr:DUF4129 domain-containing protein [Verrucomicrobiales bacterium]MDC0276089.1 DUF4129 domain-containing protein [Verrucomicrobiales bacterium]MDC0314506.1 DUF4129 domain-containing protein [bacterium]